MITVRNAVPDDLWSLVSLGWKMQAESIEPFPAVEADRVEKQLAMTIANPEALLCAVAVSDGETIGMVTAVAGDYAFSTEIRTCCDLLFVVPDRRGLVAAKYLVAAFTDWSDGLGAKTNIMGVSTGVNPERTGRLFELLGFAPMGITYRRGG